MGDCIRNVYLLTSTAKDIWRKKMHLRGLQDILHIAGAQLTIPVASPHVSAPFNNENITPNTNMRFPKYLHFSIVDDSDMLACTNQ
jgi:hypothetical protein